MRNKSSTYNIFSSANVMNCDRRPQLSSRCCQFLHVPIFQQRQRSSVVVMHSIMFLSIILYHSDALYNFNYIKSRTSEIRFSRAVIPRTTMIWRELPAKVLPLRCDMGLFKSIIKFLCSRLHVGDTPGVVNIQRRR